VTPVRNPLQRPDSWKGSTKSRGMWALTYLVRGLNQVLGRNEDYLQGHHWVNSTFFSPENNQAQHLLKVFSESKMRI
jgi:hypothetical protein